MIGLTHGMARATFTVPAAAGAYASQEIHLRQHQGSYDHVQALRVLVEDDPPTGAVVELDLLRAGGSPETDWVTATITYNAKGLGALVELAGWRGVRVRAKSGGTAGNLPVSVSWHS